MGDISIDVTWLPRLCQLLTRYGLRHWYLSYNIYSPANTWSSRTVWLLHIRKPHNLQILPDENLSWAGLQMSSYPSLRQTETRHYTLVVALPVPCNIQRRKSTQRYAQHKPYADHTPASMIWLVSSDGPMEVACWTCYSGPLENNVTVVTNAKRNGFHKVANVLYI